MCLFVMWTEDLTKYNVRFNKNKTTNSTTFKFSTLVVGPEVNIGHVIYLLGVIIQERTRSGLPLVEEVKFPWLFSLMTLKSVKTELPNISHDCPLAMSKAGEIQACINIISLWNSASTSNSESHKWYRNCILGLLIGLGSSA